MQGIQTTFHDCWVDWPTRLAEINPLLTPKTGVPPLAWDDLVGGLMKWQAGPLGGLSPADTGSARVLSPPQRTSTSGTTVDPLNELRGGIQASLSAPGILPIAPLSDWNQAVHRFLITLEPWLRRRCRLTKHIGRLVQTSGHLPAADSHTVGLVGAYETVLQGCVSTVPFAPTDTGKWADMLQQSIQTIMTEGDSPPPCTDKLSATVIQGLQWREILLNLGRIDHRFLSLCQRIKSLQPIIRAHAPALDQIRLQLCQTMVSSLLPFAQNAMEGFLGQWVTEWRADYYTSPDPSAPFGADWKTDISFVDWVPAAQPDVLRQCRPSRAVTVGLHNWSHRLASLGGRTALPAFCVDRLHYDLLAACWAWYAASLSVKEGDTEVNLFEEVNPDLTLPELVRLWRPLVQQHLTASVSLASHHYWQWLIDLDFIRACLTPTMTCQVTDPSNPDWTLLDNAIQKLEQSILVKVIDSETSSDQQIATILNSTRKQTGIWFQQCQHALFPV
ncbi:hypothetical protein BJ085DRAFT_39454 [Dimargaris cristalligena]|uniref:Uncharacterized protein n=1 Tax=Dimargaris cristalligena TaxID=215637 RepID=A0A4P9ZSX7_9FUNG|nr:hypothetical protein BJ085DRAFT_39454 [Dimargaris cristalligena]|eukprot:RKP36674.1 hypothetical protein BJ085DRAFT_39454 [Dimargaris cristalligena]